MAEAEPELDRIFRAEARQPLRCIPFAESFCANEVSAKAACENDVWVNFKYSAVSG